MINLETKLNRVLNTYFVAGVFSRSAKKIWCGESFFPLLLLYDTSSESEITYGRIYYGSITLDS
jgi:hypothetical protein